MANKPFVSSLGKIATAQDIEGFKGPDLVTLHNELYPAKPVKKFADRKSALARTTKAFAEWQGGTPAPAKQIKAAKAGKAVPSPEEGSDKTYRPNSKRGKVIELGSREGGATYKELKKATDWGDTELGAAISRIKGYSGLGVEVEGEGDERVVTVTGTLRTRKPFAFEPSEQLKAHKPGTKRALVVSMLLGGGGATFTEIQKATGWDDRTTYEGIRLIHGYLGYGLREDDDGKIHAYQGSAKDAPVPVVKEAPAKKEPKAKAAAK